MPETSNTLPRPVTKLLQVSPEYTRHMRPSELQARLREMAEELNNDDIALSFVEHEDDAKQSFEVAVLESARYKEQDEQDRGLTLAIKLSVHDNEVAAHSMAHGLVKVFLENRELMEEEFGVGRVVVLDAHPEGPERNGDELFSEELFNEENRHSLEQYLDALHRKEQPDWVYPMTYGGYEYKGFSPEAHRGTSAFMKVVDIYQPDVAIIGHNASVDEGSYILTSHNDPEFNRQVAILADEIGVHFKGHSENANNSMSREASIYPMNSLAPLYESNVALGYPAETGLIGGSTADWIRAHRGDDALTAAFEIVYFETQRSEGELSTEQKQWLLGVMNDMIQQASEALEYAGSLPENVFATNEDAKAYYDASKGPVGRFHDRLQQMNQKEPEDLTLQETSSASLYFYCVTMNDVQQLMQQLGQSERAEAIREIKQRAVAHVQEVLQPKPLAVDKQVKMQLGATACTILAKKEGRATTENNVMSEKRVTPNTTDPFQKWRTAPDGRQNT